jgi:hypothetical protein
MTTLIAPNVTVDNVMDALGVLLAFFIPVDNVARGDVNRVSMPSAPCAILTEIGQIDIEVPSTTYQPLAETATILGPVRIDIQIDFYGDTAGDLCKAVKSAFRSLWGCSQFPRNIKPLYTSDGQQAPLTTGEQQYERRWILTVSLQYDPSIIVPQQFADAATPIISAPVDLTPSS